MTNKVHKIREEVVRLQNELIQEKKKGFGSDADDACILELQNVLTYIDSLQEEPVSKELEDAADNALSNVLNTHEIVNVRSCLEMFRLGANWQREKDESTTEDLGKYINELSKQFPEVSFAKLSRIAVRVAKWQNEQIIAKATDATIGLPYENKDGGYTHLIDVSRPLPVGNNKIAIIFKKD